ncbi:MAG: hypothetical protein A3G38_03785 [Omnitrophica WOR_2 bacterium RIFCSPLOWO2_12_FULL_51_8]|nr:MAG: hypothetical protein A3G38_03785 [Omnitrophica WOR_2 bacterium RIFCSPLOWO2_12_FULL_51_8]
MEIKRNSIKVELNIAPLIDIVFNLLLFFMLSYHISSQLGISLILPQAKAAQTHEDQPVTILITREGKIYLNQGEIALDGLSAALEERLKDNQGNLKKAILKADEKINLGLAVKVMDIAKQAGIDNLIIATKPENDS